MKSAALLWELSLSLLMCTACVAKPAIQKVEMPKAASGSAMSALHTEKPRAFSGALGNQNRAILVQNNQEFIMKSADITNAEKGVFGLNFEHFSISPSGRYVTFLGIGWEWIIGTLYDANTHKILLELDSPSTFKVLPKEDRFLACTVDHFGGALYGDIYELPTGKKLFSLLDLDQMKKIQSQNLFIANLTCEDREDGTAIFTVLFDPEVMQTEVHRSLTVTVDTQTGAVKDVQEK